MTNGLLGGVFTLLLVGCGGDAFSDGSGSGGSGGSNASGGSSGSAGSASGGSSGNAGSSNGGTSNGGTSNGGTSNGGSGAVSFGGSGGEPPLPEHCSIPVTDDLAPPYQVEFVYQNFGQRPVFLHQGCVLEKTITSCADDYVEPLTTTAGCTEACSEVGAGEGCLACGACYDGGLEVPGGGGKLGEDYWYGKRYTFDTVGEFGCSCNHPHVMQAGKYRVEVPVYDSEDSIWMNAPMYTVVHDFELPSPQGIVVIDVSAVTGPGDPGDPGNPGTDSN